MTRDPHPRHPALEDALGTVRACHGHRALLSAAHLPAARPWSTGLPLDRLSAVGGLPRGRLSLLRGAPGSGKLSLALSLVARATRGLGRVAVLDPRCRFDPALGWLVADPEALTVVQVPPPAAGGAAVTLVRAGVGLLLVLEPPPARALAAIGPAAARSGSLVLATAGPEGAEALAHASSLTFALERVRWLWERGQVVGLRTLVECVKNRLGPAGRCAVLEIRYVSDRSPSGGLPIRELPRSEAPGLGRGPCRGWSAAG
ncbi:MAG TPA: hypothetical protein VFD01_01220 [Candidatus Dormibacteraeota bacterium]|nr:hypothetical protein [Candidatus Dormibacteraeota bacterium]